MNDHTPVKLTVLDLAAMKERHEPIVMVTAYDYPMARIADGAGVDAVLVGDSIGNNVLGFDSTLPVTMDEIATHTRAVSRAVTRAFVVGDMPFMSYQPSTRDAVLNAGRLMSEGSADAVKLEGGARSVEAVRAIVGAGIPVMGHIGLTPQSASSLGGYKVQGRAAAQARALFDDALALEAAGVFALVLEAIPSLLAAEITRRSGMPTIGIGAGPQCDGQVLVMHDMFGLSDRPPRFAKQYFDMRAAFEAGFKAYRDDVKSGAFPSERHSFKMSDEEASKLALLSLAGTV